MTPGTIGLNEAEPAKPMRIIKASNSLRELLDLLTERGLGYAETLCGAPEIQLLGGGDKIAEVAKLHPSSCGNPNSSSIWCSDRIRAMRDHDNGDPADRSNGPSCPL